jgi:predicted metal-binding membrane protein
MGTGSIGWMAALGAAMAIEKNTSWGRRLTQPLGVLLFACAAVVAAVNIPA